MVPGEWFVLILRVPLSFAHNIDMCNGKSPYHPFLGGTARKSRPWQLCPVEIRHREVEEFQEAERKAEQQLNTSTIKLQAIWVIFAFDWVNMGKPILSAGIIRIRALKILKHVVVAIVS